MTRPWFLRLLRDRSGVSTIEYAVLAFVIVAVVGAVMATYTLSVNGAIGNLQFDIEATAARAAAAARGS